MTHSSPSAKQMGPIERELRTHPCANATDEQFSEWAWNLTWGALSAISNVYVPGPRRRLGAPGFGISLHTDKRRIRDAISEAIEAAEALGL